MSDAEELLWLRKRADDLAAECSCQAATIARLEAERDAARREAMEGATVSRGTTTYGAVPTSVPTSGATLRPAVVAQTGSALGS